MASVFDTKPPDYSEIDAVRICEIHYNMHGKAVDLYSERDQNFLFIAEDDRKFVLKIFNPAEDRSILEMQHKTILFIRSKDPGLGVPIQVGEIQIMEKDEVSNFVRLISYLDGQFLKDAALDEKSCEKLGGFLGRLSHAMDGFSHPAADREFEWDVRSVSLIKSRMAYLEKDEQQKTVAYFLNEYEQHVSPFDLRMAVIHNDGNDYNVLINENGETTGIIDFGDMVYSYQVAEPAVCMAYVGLEKDDPFSAMAQVLKGYHSVFPLHDAEIIAAIYLSCVRLCISVTMSAWRMKLFPENEYLSVSQKPAWIFLNKMENEDLSEWSNRLVNYVK